MGKQVKVGDVIEIQTKRGFAYAQYALKKNQWGALLRILPGFFEQRPADVCAHVRVKERFVTFFPLQAAVNREVFAVVAHCEVPEFAQQFPLFRAAGYIDRHGKVHDWWLWNGDREWRIDRLSSEQAKLPIRAVWNDTLLIERIEEGWTPETDLRTVESISK